ncbi:hypothetical protein [Schnuerera sp.]|uniref:hypothetical protein n=1 Tax=Schnuerera sp. TaxID=2794844 RepID=UPI002BF714EE|nr:hypothetical protein [Schnuerera sp.]HSH35977.1 hypothetical protein [Schnuerera sp.]
MRKRVYTPIKSYKFKNILEKTTDNFCGFLHFSLIMYKNIKNEWRFEIDENNINRWKQS